MGQTIREAEPHQHLPGRPRRVSRPPPDPERHLDVLERRELREEVVELEYKAHLAIAVLGQIAAPQT